MAFMNAPFHTSLLEQFSPEWNVDCEYNKIEDQPKIYRAIRSIKAVIQGKLGKKHAAFLNDSGYTLDEPEFEIFCREAFPDIIIHRRGRTGIEDNFPSD
jgi:hypothetical protein